MPEGPRVFASAPRPRRDGVAPRSYWQYFGTYIWFVIIGLRPLGQFLCAIVEEQLQEALLVMPVMTAFDMTCGA
jgi:hypothetical protein